MARPGPGRGLISFAVTSSDNIIGPGQARFLASVRQTLASVFGPVAVFPGDSARFVARRGGRQERDPRVIVRRLQARHVKTQYVRAETLPFDYSLFRQDALATVLDRAAGTTSVNSDLNPRCYFYGLALWSAQHSPLVARVFDWLDGVKIWWIFAALGLLGLVMWLGRRRWAGAWPLAAVAGVGFTEMSLEIVALITLQTLCGRVFEAIGLLAAAYMIGLAGAAAWITGRLDRIERPRRALGGLQFLAAGLALAVLGIIFALGHWGPAPGLGPGGDGGPGPGQPGGRYPGRAALSPGRPGLPDRGQGGGPGGGPAECRGPDRRRAGGLAGWIDAGANAGPDRDTGGAGRPERGRGPGTRAGSIERVVPVGTSNSRFTSNLIQPPFKNVFRPGLSSPGDDAP